MPPPAFVRVAAAASVLSAVTTLLLIFLPEWFAPAPDFAARMARVYDPPYQLRSWVYLLHPFLVFTAALGVFLLLRRATALALPGILGFGLWAATEAAQQCLTLFAFDRWRRAWLAGDAAVRASMEVRTAIYDGLWDAAYMLLLIGFLIGNTAFGAALVRMRGLDRVVGGFFLAAAALTASILLVDLGGPAIPEPLASWVYPAIQPLARVLIGVWLWRMAKQGVARGPV
jgi:hypothetical protein